MTWQWPSFSPEEILSPEGLRLWYNRGILQISTDSLDKLQKLRSELNMPLLVNHGGLRLRGWRSPEENKSIAGSAKYSAHILGRAFDISCRDLGLEVVEEKALEVGFTWTKIYHSQGFIHIEDRFRQ